MVKLPSDKKSILFSRLRRDHYIACNSQLREGFEEAGHHWVEFFDRVRYIAEFNWKIKDAMQSRVPMTIFMW